MNTYRVKYPALTFGKPFHITIDKQEERFLMKSNH